MSKPRIYTEEWDEAFPDKWSVCRIDGGASPWGVFPPVEECQSKREYVAWFGSHEHAVHHLINKGWRK